MPGTGWSGISGNFQRSCLEEEGSPFILDDAGAPGAAGAPGRSTSGGAGHLPVDIPHRPPDVDRPGVNGEAGHRGVRWLTGGWGAFGTGGGGGRRGRIGNLGGGEEERGEEKQHRYQLGLREGMEEQELPPLPFENVEPFGSPAPSSLLPSRRRRSTRPFRGGPIRSGPDPLETGATAPKARNGIPRGLGMAGSPQDFPLHPVPGTFQAPIRDRHRTFRRGGSASGSRGPRRPPP